MLKKSGSKKGRLGYEVTSAVNNNILSYGMALFLLISSYDTTWVQFDTSVMHALRPARHPITDLLTQPELYRYLQIRFILRIAYALFLIKRYWLLQRILTLKREPKLKVWVHIEGKGN